METVTEQREELKQKIFKLNPEHRRRLAVASHLNFMNETELIRVLIDQAYEHAIKNSRVNV